MMYQVRTGRCEQGSETEQGPECPQRLDIAYNMPSQHESSRYTHGGTSSPLHTGATFRRTIAPPLDVLQLSQHWRMRRFPAAHAASLATIIRLAHPHPSPWPSSSGGVHRRREQNSALAAVISRRDGDRVLLAFSAPPASATKLESKAFIERLERSGVSRSGSSVITLPARA